MLAHVFCYRYSRRLTARYDTLTGGCRIMLNNPVSLPFHSPVPKDRDKLYFKLRQNVQKKVLITVQQISNKELGIERWEPVLWSNVAVNFISRCENFHHFQRITHIRLFDVPQNGSSKAVLCVLMNITLLWFAGCYLLCSHLQLQS